MLRSLLSAHGVNPQMITVFIDGYYEVSQRGDAVLHLCLCTGKRAMSSCVGLLGAHGRCRAVWTQGDSAHAHQHQERQSVPGKTLQAAASYLNIWNEAETQDQLG